MKPTLIAVWFLLPCDSPMVEDRATRTTTVISCPDTFREGAGPYLAEGWKPPVAAPAVTPAREASAKKPVYTHKNKPKKKKKKKRRR